MSNVNDLTDLTNLTDLTMNASIAKKSCVASTQDGLRTDGVYRMVHRPSSDPEIAPKEHNVKRDGDAMRLSQLRRLL